MTCSPIWSWLQKWVGTAVWSLELIYERGAACLPSWAGGESVVGNAEMEKDKRKFSLFNLLTLDLSKKIKALTGSPRSAAAAGNNSDSLPELRKPWTVKSPSCGHFYLSSCGDRSQLFILKLLIKGQKGRIFTRADKLHFFLPCGYSLILLRCCSWRFACSPRFGFLLTGKVLCGLCFWLVPSSVLHSLTHNKIFSSLFSLDLWLKSSTFLKTTETRTFPHF